MPPGCGGLCIAIEFAFLVIVYIVHIDYVAAFEAEGHAPIPRHRNRIVPFQRSLQCV
jgi:hypothetical protein